MSMENEEYNEIFKDWKTYVDSKDFLDKMEAPIRRMLNQKKKKKKKKKKIQIKGGIYTQYGIRFIR